LFICEAVDESSFVENGITVLAKDAVASSVLPLYVIKLLTRSFLEFEKVIQQMEQQDALVNKYEQSLHLLVLESFHLKVKVHLEEAHLQPSF
jgi:hypothetical protein